MAIDLPAPVTPQQAPVAELVAQAQGAFIIPYGKLRIHVFGPAVESGLISAARLSEDVAKADTVSDAVRTIGYLYYVSGYPAELTSYALADPQNLYVRVVPGCISEVRAPSGYQPFLSGLPSHSPLTDASLERARALADVLGERSGEKYTASLTAAGPDSVLLDLGPPSQGTGQTLVRGDFSNYGNRYSGPYLADASLRRSFSSGDEVVLSGITSVRFLGLGGSNSEPYHEGDIQWSHITPIGLFSLDGRYADFAQDDQGLRLSGTLSTGSISWLFPVYADFRQRINILSKLDRNHEAAHAEDPPGTELLSELYNSAELNGSYVWRTVTDGRQRWFSITATARKGLSSRSQGTTSNTGYFLGRSSLSGQYDLTAHIGLLANADFQFGGSSVPQLEQFVIGGPASAHAYEAGAGVGDRGMNLRLATEVKANADSFLERYGVRPKIFVEYGTTTSSPSSTAPAAGSVSVADVGVEAGVRFLSWLGAGASIAQSIHEEGGERSPNGLAKNYVYFRLSAQY
ncbi:MAG: hypothetical protein JWR07_3277 [Nevskia sp.]|nr:hypothetical protein [Nevskia sp.]